MEEWEHTDALNAGLVDQPAQMSAKGSRFKQQEITSAGMTESRAAKYHCVKKKYILAPNYSDLALLFA